MEWSAETYTILINFGYKITLFRWNTSDDVDKYDDFIYKPLWAYIFLLIGFIRYINDYNILKNRVPRQLLPHLSKIFSVCCYLTTLQPVKLREIDEMFESLASH